VVVNYRAGDLLTACARSILEDGSAGAAEVVVVDNGSADGSVARLQKAVPTVRVLDAGGNIGYGAAANRGIAATTAPVVAVCNADLTVAPGTAAAMVTRLDTEPDLAAVGPLIRNTDGTVYPSARSVPALRDAIGHAVLGARWPDNRFSRRYRQLDADPAVPRDVDWISGAAMWLRRSALDSVGGWDEHYFMYGEDADLCWRMRRLGWRVAYDPRGSVVHTQGVSTDQHPYRMIVRHHRSVYRFASKRWHGARRLLLAPAAVLLGVRAAFAIAARALRRRRPGAEGTG
jgi:N-acetylglucosaminyl-diphospho-decaprenol L-rhamnosyltransferase